LITHVRQQRVTVNDIRKRGSIARPGCRCGSCSNADSPKIIEEHAKCGGFPANRISRVHAIMDPTTAQVAREKSAYQERPDPHFRTYSPKTRCEFLNLLARGGA
jgi:hypothetical protein